MGIEYASSSSNTNAFPTDRVLLHNTTQKKLNTQKTNSRQVRQQPCLLLSLVRNANKS